MGNKWKGIIRNKKLFFTKSERNGNECKGMVSNGKK